MFLPFGDNINKNSFPIVTVALILLNVAAFAYCIRVLSAHQDPEAAMHAAEELYKTWGLVPKELANGQVIGLLTCMFLHGGLMHIIGNMLVLWAFGPSLEQGLGKLTFAAFFFIWGTVAGLAQCMVDWSSEMPMVGASGAIAGMIGAYTVLYGYSANIKILWLIWVYPVRFQMPAIAFGGAWFLLQMWNGSFDVEGNLSGVAWMAHIGGFAAGVLTMLAFRNFTDRKLVQNESGELEFESRETQAAADQVTGNEVSEAFSLSDELRAAGKPATGCQFCSTPLDETDQIGPGIYRCPNAVCDRLNYIFGGVASVHQPLGPLDHVETDTRQTY